jgi:hypothetical protein
LLVVSLEKTELQVEKEFAKAFGFPHGEAASMHEEVRKLVDLMQLLNSGQYYSDALVKRLALLSTGVSEAVVKEAQLSLKCNSEYSKVYARVLCGGKANNLDKDLKKSLDSFKAELEGLSAEALDILAQTRKELLHK